MAGTWQKCVEVRGEAIYEDCGEDAGELPELRSGCAARSAGVPGMRSG